MENPYAFWFIITAFLLLVVAIAVVAHLRAKKRREALEVTAQALGLQFFPKKDRRAIAQFKQLDEFQKGSNRYLSNRMRGSYKGMPVEVFDYHYQIRTGSGKNSSTRHYYFTIFICLLPKSFPELRIYREGFFEKLIQFVGFEDIHFESAEFSKRVAIADRFLRRQRMNANWLVRLVK